MPNFDFYYKKQNLNTVGAFSKFNKIFYKKHNSDLNFNFIDKIPLKNKSNVFLDNYNINYSEKLKIKNNSVLRNTYINSVADTAKYLNNLYKIYISEKTNYKFTNNFVRNIVSKLNRIKLWDPNLNCALYSIDILSQNGWCVCTAEDISNLILVKDSSSKKVLQQFEQIYSDDKILEILEEIIHSFKESRLLKNGRIEMLKDMLIVLKKDINKHYLFCGNIFGICEYLFF